MSAASSPRFQPDQQIGASNGLWYALVLALVLLGCAGLLVVAALQGPPAEGQLLAPFRWFPMSMMA